jgi:hypothetical protein
MSDTFATTTTAPSAPAADPGELGPPIAPRAAPTAVTPGSKAWADLPPEQRHAQLRGPENPRARGHSPARDTYERIRHAQDQAPGEAAPPAGDQQQPPAPAGEKHKIGQYEVSEADLGAMMERQALDDLRKATIPPTPQDYKLALPENLKLPGGIEFKFDEAGNKATFDAAKAWAHNHGMNQTDFSEMMGLYASHVAQQEAVLATRSQQEIAKAGVNAPQRVDAVGKWITGMVGEADARQIRAGLVTDAHLRFYETIMTKITNQGGAIFSAAHRVPDDSRHEIPGYANMSFEQRRQAQDQRAQRGGR